MIKSYKEFAINLAKNAGKIMLHNFSLGIKKSWKVDHTPLTIADTAINNLVINEIRKYFPAHGVVGEEESNPQKDAEYVWVCDPIDGTIPFSHGIPIATFSLALTHKGKVILGVVYDPFLDRLFFAEKNKGAFLNGKKIAVSNAKQLTHATITIDSLDSTFYAAFAVWQLLMGKNVKVISFASFVYNAMLVACGEIQASIYGGTKPWDVAAVKLIVEEAGGKCTDISGKDQLYDQEVNGFIADNGLLHQELVAIIKNTTPDQL